MAIQSVLGFGVSGALGTPLVSARHTRLLIRRAAAAGVTVFDTAPSYGAGEAERRLGRALATLQRDRLVICSKVGFCSHGLKGRRRDFSPDGVEASVRASLARLRVEGLDILFLHGADPGELTPALMARLDALRQAGAFHTLGAAGRGAELDAALQTGRVEALMAPAHPFLSEAERARLATARAVGVTVFGIETAGDAPPARQWPRRVSDLYGLARSLQTLDAGRGRVAVPDGLRQALAAPDIDTVMFTTTQRAHLDANLALAGLS